MNLHPDVRDMGEIDRMSRIVNEERKWRRMSKEYIGESCGDLAVSAVSVNAHLCPPTPYFSPLVINEAF